MPEHPNAVRFRAAFDALWTDGDMQPMIDNTADDHLWINDIGAGPWRHLQGKDESLAFALWWTDFFEGSFRHELIDVCASDDRVIEVLREVGEKEGHVFDNLALYVYEIGPDGRATTLRTFDRDREAVDEFWSHFPEVMALDTAEVLASFAAALG